MSFSAFTSTKKTSNFNKPGLQFTVAIGVVFLAAFLCFVSVPVIGYRVVALILLTVVSLLAMTLSVWPVIVAATISAFLWNFFFIPPLYTFHIDNAEDILMFLLYFIIALVNTVLQSRIRTEREKARDKEEKVKSIQLYHTLLNSLSHEMKTPISAIISSVDGMKYELEHHNLTALSELIAEVEIAGTRLHRQVENMLNMNRLESGMLQARPDWCEVSEVIYGAVGQMEEKQVQRIKVNLSKDLPLVKIDMGFTSQALYNLLQNALSYGGGGEIEVGVDLHDGYVDLYVKDQGPGLDEEDALKVFDKFYRAPGSKAGGIGLGLAVVKGFCEAQGGEVSVKTAPGKGCLFTLHLPTETTYINQLKNE